jgi:hypothetical protein
MQKAIEARKMERGFSMISSLNDGFPGSDSQQYVPTGCDLPELLYTK